jgi:gamma-glutamyltranspeptidase/glutathione hydrolase
MRPGTLSVESRIPSEVQDALKAKGHRLSVSGPWSMAEMAVIQINWKTGVLNAGADPRVEAYAWAR